MCDIIKNVLTSSQLIEIQQILDTCEYVDGKITAGKFAKEIKSNLQATPHHCRKAVNIVMHALLSNQEFQSKSLYKIINDPLFSKYIEGMYYGAHTDDPIMNSKHGAFRTDLAMTLFLNEPSEYEGGELCINENKYKLAAGSLLLYPANTIHSVTPVIAGTRSVMVNWCQSLIKDPTKREILIELENARIEPTFDKINNSYSKLMRMWADI